MTLVTYTRETQDQIWTVTSGPHILGTVWQEEDHWVGRTPERHIGIKIRGATRADAARDLLVHRYVIG